MFHFIEVADLEETSDKIHRALVSDLGRKPCEHCPADRNPPLERKPVSDCGGLTRQAALMLPAVSPGIELPPDGSRGIPVCESNSLS